MAGAITLVSVAVAVAVENWAACTCSAAKALPAVVGILTATVRPERRKKAVLLELRALLWRRERNMVVVVKGRKEGRMDLLIYRYEWKCGEARHTVSIATIDIWNL